MTATGSSPGATGASVEGQVAAAAAVLQSMRGNWVVTPAVAFNRNQDLVHRVIGRPGVVVVGEGVPGRTVGLMAQERRAGGAGGWRRTDL